MQEWMGQHCSNTKDYVIIVCIIVTSPGGRPLRRLGNLRPAQLGSWECPALPKIEQTLPGPLWFSILSSSPCRQGRLPSPFPAGLPPPCVFPVPGMQSCCPSGPLILDHEAMA